MATPDFDNMDEVLTITVRSQLPEGEPQGDFALRVPSTATGRQLLRLLCREAKITMTREFFLHLDNGSLVPLDCSLTAATIKEGSVVYWNREGELLHAPGIKRCNTYWLLGGISLLIGFIGLIVIIYINHQKEDNYSYGVVFDAGSSHTSMFIYKWDSNKLNQTGLVVQEGPKCDVAGGAISAYASNASEAGPVLKQCLDIAVGRIPTEKHGQTPVYLGATAGMRLLEKKNKSASEAVMKSVQRTLSQYPFQFHQPETQAHILSGMQEGAYSWITSNYIAGTFHVHPPSDAVVPDLIVSSVGALDLGGASAQISFIANNSNAVPDEFSFRVPLYGRNYSLYTYSFLCYGVNEAATHLQAVLLQAQNFTSTVSNPCAPKGSIFNVSHVDIFSSPCVTGDDGELAFGHRVQPPSGYMDIKYSFVGESNASACGTLVNTSLFNFSAPCNFSHCSFSGVFQPPVFGDYYAFSSFFHIMDFLNLTSSDFIPYFSFANASWELCNMEWTKVQRMKTAVPSNLPWYCFQSIYINLLLVKGYQFDPSASWNSIHFVETVGGMDVGWTLGFMITQSNEAPVETAERPMEVVLFVLLVVLFIAFIIVAFFFALKARSYMRLQRSYSLVNSYGSI